MVPTMAMISSAASELQPSPDSGHEHVVGNRPGAGVGDHHQRDHQDVEGQEEEHEPLPGLEPAGDGDGHQQDGAKGDGDVGAEPEVAGPQGDADELGDDGQEVEDKEVTNREGAPELAEPLEDEPPVSDPGDRAEADDHLLVDDQHRDEQHQHPEQAGAIVLARLGIGRDTPGVVVADHHDQARAHDHGQGEEPLPPGPASPALVLGDGPEGAPDVALVRVVEDRAAPRRRRALEPLLDQAVPPAAAPAA